MMVRSIALLLGFFVIASSVEAAVQSKKVTYKHGDQGMYRLPGVRMTPFRDLVPESWSCHEFWGLDAVRQATRQLASGAGLHRGSPQTCTAEGKGRRNIRNDAH